MGLPRLIRHTSIASNVFLCKPVLKTTEAKRKQRNQLVHIYSNPSFSQVSMMKTLAISLVFFFLHNAKAKYFLVETADSGANNDYCEDINDNQESPKTTEEGP